MVRALAVAMVIAAAGTAVCADVTPEGVQTEVAAADREFIADVARGGQLQVELGRLAMTNSSSEPVRRFGQRMMDDHGRTNEQLAELAKRRGVRPDTAMKPDQQVTVDSLGRMKGDAFDRRYMEVMLQDHREDIQRFERAADAAGDPEVRAFARRTLPTLRQHLQLALGVASATSGTRTP